MLCLTGLQYGAVQYGELQEGLQHGLQELQAGEPLQCHNTETLSRSESARDRNKF